MIIAFLLLQSLGGKNEFANDNDKKIGVISKVVVLSLLAIACSSTDTDTTNTSESIEIQKCTIEETAVYGELEVTVTGFFFSDYLAEVTGGMQAGDGYMWCIIDLSIKNIGHSLLK